VVEIVYSDHRIPSECLAKRSFGKPYFYRDLIGVCCWPGCLCRITEVHHIIPLALGGKDTYSNYICLCKDHHSPCEPYRLDDKKLSKIRELFVYKYFIESLLLGFTSDIPEKEFRKKIARIKADKSIREWLLKPKQLSDPEEPLFDNEEEEEALFWFEGIGDDHIG